MIKKTIIFFIIIIVVISGIGFSAFKLLGSNDKNEVEKVVDKQESKIDGYDIKINDNDTALYKREYEVLKENLNSKEINYEAYAKSVAKMFIIDLYTMTNKVNKYDVGGIEFVLKSVRDNYSLNVENTIYKYLEDNTKGDRNQNLPEVISIDVLNFTETKFKFDSTNKTYDAYKVELSWDYKVDYGYDKKGEVIVIKVKNKMYVVEKN